MGEAALSASRLLCYKLRPGAGCATSGSNGLAGDASTMKNFVRALRFSWPYRGRLLISLLCALLAAVFWSLNFTAITPVLTILTKQENLQEWIERQIDETQKIIDKNQPLVEERSRESSISGRPRSSAASSTSPSSTYAIASTAPSFTSTWTSSPSTAAAS